MVEVSPSTCSRNTGNRLAGIGANEEMLLCNMSKLVNCTLFYRFLTWRSCWKYIRLGFSVIFVVCWRLKTFLYLTVVDILSGMIWYDMMCYMMIWYVDSSNIKFRAWWTWFVLFWCLYPTLCWRYYIFVIELSSSCWSYSNMYIILLIILMNIGVLYCTIVFRLI